MLWPPRAGLEPRSSLFPEALPPARQQFPAYAGLPTQGRKRNSLFMKPHQQLTLSNRISHSSHLPPPGGSSYNLRLMSWDITAGLQTGTSAPQSALPTATSVPQPDPAPPTPLPPTSTEFVQRVVAALPTSTSAQQPTHGEAVPQPSSSATSTTQPSPEAIHQ